MEESSEFSYDDLLLGLAIIEHSVNENKPRDEAVLRYYQRVLLKDIKKTMNGGIGDVTAIKQSEISN